jgi:ATP-dependent Clp protease adaptor protein ClpS
MTKKSQTAVAEPEQVERTLPPKRRRAQARPRPKQQPRYHVILWDDPNHSFGYVIVMLQQLFGHPLTKGYQLADEVHHRGKAIVLTTTMEHAELKRDQIRAFGGKVILNEVSIGSMFATIEPSP